MKQFRRLTNLAGGVMVLVGATLTAAEPNTIPGIGPVSPIVKLHGDLKFTEGPASDGQGNLFFTDIPANRIYKVDQAGKLEVFLEPSSHANGLMFNAKGMLFACQMDGRLVTIDPKTKVVKIIADGYQGKRFNAPNDLVLDRTGGIYFTDPHFLAPEPLPQKKVAVYYRAADGTVSRLIDDLAAPNGVILSPDEKTLYVVPTGQKEMMAYSIAKPGQLANDRVFCTLKQVQPENKTGGDGLAVDTKGNLYITSQLGLQVFNPRGEAMGIIKFPEQPANVTFGGPKNNTLFVTARNSLYKAEMEATGHVFPGVDD